MRRALKILPFVIAGCLAILALSHAPGIGFHNGRAIGESFGAALFMLVAGLFGAGIARLINRRSENGPLITASLIVATMTLLNLMAMNA